MAVIIEAAPSHPLELPEPSIKDELDPLGARLGVAMRWEFLNRFHVDAQIGTVWLGLWGTLSVATFIVGLAVEILGGLQQVNDNFADYIRYFANIQVLPPDNGLAFPNSWAHGGYWMAVMTFWAASVGFWGLRCWERLMRFQWRPYLFFAFVSAISLTTSIWVIRPLIMGSWAEAPGFGLNVDLDWAQNISVLWGNFYYNPWHQLSIFFLLGSTMLWGMHGGTILATSSEGSHHEDSEIKDMHSGSHKSMLFWRWTMGFNANPKTIHDWIWWFATMTTLAGAIGVITTGWVTNDWYVWAVDHGTVQQYGPITRSAINGRPGEQPLVIQPGLPVPGYPKTTPLNETSVQKP
ncbi:reaction center protein M chain [Vulcanimicrobium alpinum]|uniref:Reaction center protein M chain n=1 Tax=Vulcanimicrobium alpinum TaxID=3016050 RepID=A0AAN2CAV8_UNVUL|nr:hypothetical protein [Vulcanimicrobium alpinum]BDE07348.1 reaction center protein M chain [Vulcanimicrobium alpinum]